MHELYTNAFNSEGRNPRSSGSSSITFPTFVSPRWPPSSWLYSYSFYSGDTAWTVNNPDDTYQQPWLLHYLALPNNVLLWLGTGSFNEKDLWRCSSSSAIRVCCIMEPGTYTAQVFGRQPLDLCWVGASWPSPLMQGGNVEDGCYSWGPDRCQAPSPGYLQCL